MENTLGNKAKFLAQYWGQEVLIANSHVHQRIPFNNIQPWIYHNVDISWLELTNIDDITDEHAQFLGFEDAKHFFHEGHIGNMLDDLRLLGYAVDWADLSVEEMEAYGWLKLKIK